MKGKEKSRWSHFGEKPHDLWCAFSSMGRVGGIVLLLMVLLTVLSLGFMGDRHQVPSGDSLEAPSLEHWLGTDDLGIDLFAQICHGAAISLAVGFSAALLAGVGGSLIGMVAGYYGGWIDKFILGLCDLIMAMPKLPLMIVLGAFFGSGLINIILVIALMSWAGPARTARSKIFAMRREPYIIASKSYGSRFFHLARRHFLPGLFPIVMVGVIRTIGHAIVMEAGLSFLGLGDPTSKSWGIILNRAINFSGIYFTEFWKWWIMAPLVALILLVVSTALIGRDFERLLNQKR